MTEEPPIPAVAATRLRDLLEGRRRRLSAERCEVCGAEIEPEHGHLVDVVQRALLCVCRACYLLFTQDGAGGARFRAVPARYIEVSSDAVSDLAWDSLQVPVGITFFFFNSLRGRVAAFYPSPSGATESELTLEAWHAIVQLAPVLDAMIPDVEALLVRRPSTSLGPPSIDERDRRLDAFLVPIDACYELVGVIRRELRGFHGGDVAWREVDAFFDRIRARAVAAETR